MRDFLEALPRYPLVAGETPLDEMPRLRASLAEEFGACPHLFIKRDDLTGLAGGGNKTRKLEYLIGDALAQNADTVITTGALQSNHVRQTVAAAAKAGLKAHAVLFDTVPYQGKQYRSSGNYLLDQVLGATVHVHPADADALTVIKTLLAEIGDAGGTPYFIPVGGSNALGSAGYVRCFQELQSQLDRQALQPTRLVHATSSLGTQSGLLAGRALTGSSLRIDGINVYRSSYDTMADELLDLAQQTVELAGGAVRVSPDDVHLDHRHLGEGYGVPTEAMVAAVRRVAQTEGILLDPVYSGKAMGGLITNISNGEYGADETVVFLHTGGMPGLFAYEEEFSVS